LKKVLYFYPIDEIMAPQVSGAEEKVVVVGKIQRTPCSTAEGAAGCADMATASQFVFDYFLGCFCMRSACATEAG
jgi:hypothetical protein